MSLDVNAKQTFAVAPKPETNLAKPAQKPEASDTDKAKVVEKDTLKVAPGLEKKSSEELTKLYEAVDTDGPDEAGFEALLNAVVAPESQAETTSASATQTITVKPGDTLSKIARQNNVSIDELEKANPDLFKDGKDATGKKRSAAGDLIYPGDTITLPPKSATKPAETVPAETKPTDVKPDPVDTSAEKKIKQAKETIDSAKLYKLDPEAAKLLPAEDLKAIKELDQKTVVGAQDALGQIPAKDAKRADYEGKVKTLEGEFNTRYGVAAPAEKIVVDEDLDDNEVRHMLNKRTPEEVDKLNPGTRIGMIKALDRGATSETEDQMIGGLAQSIARTHPEALTPDVVKHMEDDGVREFVKGAPDEVVDKVPAESRGAMIHELAEGITSQEEDQMIGKLGASLAKTHPETLTPDVIRTMEDDGVRELMDRVDAQGLAKLSPDARTTMIQELASGATTHEEDALIGRLGTSIAATHPESLTPELVRTMEDDGVLMMTKDMSVEDLGKLQRPTLSAMREELRGGWTTGEEYDQIDKITQALPNAK